MAGRASKRAARRAVSKRHGQPARRPRAVSSGPPRRFNNLPPQRTSFVGREREIAQIKQLLETTGLLTMTMDKQLSTTSRVSSYVKKWGTGGSRWSV